MLEIRKKRKILMPQVGNKYLLVRTAERRHVHQSERRYHYYKRNKKCEYYIDVL